MFMENLIELSSQDLSIHETIDFDTLTWSRDGAQPTNQVGCEIAYVDIMTGPNGKRYRVTFGFTVAEEEAADSVSNFLPWDVAHVFSCEEI